MLQVSVTDSYDHQDCGGWARAVGCPEFQKSSAIFPATKPGVGIGPGGLRSPCVLACAMRSLAIVITIVQSLFLSLSVFGFDPLRGNSRVRNNFCPNILV